MLCMGVKLDLLLRVKKNRLRVFEVKVRRRITGPKRQGFRRSWRKLHNEVFHNS